VKGKVAGGFVALEAASEAVWLFGHTTRIRTEVAPRGVELSAGAVVARLGLRLPSIGLRAGFEFGLASGDNDPNDAISQSFRFDPDYQPSLLLFRHVLAAISGHSMDRAIDPNRVGYPVPGSDQIATFGQVSNTLYLQPVLAWRPFVNMSKWVRELELKVGLLYAMAAADFLDPLNTVRAGGVNTTPFGQAAAERRDLGLELNLALSYRLPIWRTLSMSLMVLYGRFFPGNAFEMATGASTPIDVFQARLTTRF
jgi:hypothetical protein